MKYRTKQGDTLDYICWLHYGTEEAVSDVLEANQHLAEQPEILPAGLTIELPEIDTTAETSPTINLFN